ncbi:MAG: hypothetical protein H0W72_16245, partial [Planctomycetes bacterium]|nr:hypothetical protein [Planctomycetota bacterium]
GGTISAYQSMDGVTWQLVGTAAIAMGSNLSIGLAVTSTADGAPSIAVFDNVSVVGAVGGAG